MNTLEDINNFIPYNGINVKDSVCHKMTYIIKVDETNGMIYLNNDKTNKFGAVVTLSTNTDVGRNLNRDSFGILKFIDETDDLVDRCVESDSEDEKEIRKNKKLTKIQRLKNTIINLAEKSNKNNNSEKNLELKQYINKYFYPTEILNLEIYEFLLKNYPEDAIKRNIITTSIEESSDDICGIIKTEPSIQNIGTTKQSPRSCDPINGKLTNNPNYPTNPIDPKCIIPLAPSSNPNYDFSLNINGKNILSSDLIKFTNLYGAKQTFRKKIDPITSRIDSIAPLYINSDIVYIFDTVRPILENQWKKLEDPLVEDSYYESNSLIKILNPNKDQKFIIIGDLHGSFATFIRILLRFRKMGIMDSNGYLINNHHVIFLGDIVDRGVYGYEIIMLLYCLNILNPDTIHLNRGNHESEDINSSYGLSSELDNQFPDDANDLFNDINHTMLRQSSAILIQNPFNNKYIYLSHGGLPTDDSFGLDPIIDINNFKDKYLIVSDTIGRRIRWNDFASIKISERSPRSDDDIFTVIGYDVINKAIDLGIELIIRGHLDFPNNTKLLCPL